MKKDHQTKAAPAATDEFVMADTVAVAMGELAETVKEGLLALAVGAGLQVMQVMMADSVAAVCGPKGRHDAERSAVRHGTEDGSVTLGGRRVPVRRPRVRSADGKAEVAVPAYDVFASTELLGEMALERMMAKLSTRRYSAGLEPVGTTVEASARSTSKSAVSRRFVTATETALATSTPADRRGDCCESVLSRVALSTQCRSSFERSRCHQIAVMKACSCPPAVSDAPATRPRLLMPTG